MFIIIQKTKTFFSVSGSSDCEGRADAAKGCRAASAPTTSTNPASGKSNLRSGLRGREETQSFRGEEEQHGYWMEPFVHWHPQLREISANTPSNPPEFSGYIVSVFLLLQTEHYLEQQMSISRLRQNLLAIRTSILETRASGTADDTTQSVCLMRHDCKYENTGRVGNSEYFPVTQVTLFCHVAHSISDFLMQQVLLGERLSIHLSELGPLQSPNLFSGEGNGRL